MASTVVTVRTPGRRPIAVVLEERLELGRDCDGLIVPDTRMSRRHVALEPGPDETVIVTDLGSSNGTTIDDEPVLYPSPVTDGATVRAGSTEIVIGRQRVKRVGGGSAVDETSLATSIEVVAEQAVQDLRPEMVGVRDEPGTLTIGFTDIEASTDLAVALGDKAWFELVQEHQREVAQRVTAAGGRVVSVPRRRLHALLPQRPAGAPVRDQPPARHRGAGARRARPFLRSPHRPAHRRGARR